MRDLMMIAFIFFLLGAAMARPFLMSMAYIYVDLVSPQRITYYLLSSIPFSMIMAALAVIFFIAFEDKKNLKFSRLQALMLVWMIWITLTTLVSELPEFAWEKWDSAWKSIAFGIFLPFILTSRQRIETALYFVVLCVGVITITGGIKTLLGGGGYGTLNLLVESNSGLYEGSTISAVAVAIIPLILYLHKHNTLFPRSLLLTLAAGGLIFSSVLIPIGTEARTGLICLALLGGMVWLKAKRKILMIALLGGGLVAAIPFLPESFTGRMSTIETHNSDESASTRVAVWKWTMGFAAKHPLGGGFDAYRLNTIEYDIVEADGRVRHVVDRSRAYHSSWFETLGGHGYPGLLIYLGLQLTALFQMWGLSRRFKAAGPEDAWIRDLATALFQTILTYMAGSTFVGIAFQTTLYLLLALAGALVTFVSVRDEAERKAKMTKPRFVPGVGVVTTPAAA